MLLRKLASARDGGGASFGLTGVRGMSVGCQTSHAGYRILDTFISWNPLNYKVDLGINI